MTPPSTLFSSARSCRRRSVVTGALARRAAATDDGDDRDGRARDPPRARVVSRLLPAPRRDDVRDAGADAEDAASRSHLAIAS
jgi:hypothetical protein